jgi:PleD family two-component response regulator
LLLARDEERAALRALLAEPGPAAYLRLWEAVEADSFEFARYLLQLDVADVMLVDESILLGDNGAGLAWLGRTQEVPAILLTEAQPEKVSRLQECGVQQWLPRRLVLSHPALLASALRQALRLREQHAELRRTREALRESQRRLTSLVHMLWDVVPLAGKSALYTQRHMMDRLREEVARSERHGNPLSVVLGEVQAATSGPVHMEKAAELPPEMREKMSEWTIDRIHQGKRRYDVAGQYGPHGFMVLLPHTGSPGAVSFCRRLKGLLETSPPATEPALSPVHACFGLAQFAAETASPKTLLRRAEEELERSRAALEPMVWDV